MNAVLPKDIPAPESYVRYWDADARETRYMRLLSRRGPLYYPKRYPAVAAGALGAEIVFSELNPSTAKRHIYLAYPGLSKGFLWNLWHPYSIKALAWDEDIRAIEEDLTAVLHYEDSPYEAPAYPVWIQHDRYPMLKPRNVSGESKNPAIMWVAYVYLRAPQEELTERELSNLRNGTLRSLWSDFGGEIG